MLLLRPVQTSDLDNIAQLAEQAGVGLTTLSTDRAILQDKIQHAQQTFTTPSDTPQGYYLFALSDQSTQQVIGTSAIDAAVGQQTPFYSYKCSQITRVCHELKLRNSYQLLNLVNDYENKSELCTLFLAKPYRKNGNGLFLSLARFLFMAEFPQQFSATIFAEMRGVSDDQGHSPFWNSLGKHFFSMSFAEADHLTTASNKQFIADLMPRHPIYVELLDPAAQAVIGKPHRSTQAAMKILQREGFAWHDYIDIFDAGPTIEAQRDSIRTITSSHCVTLAQIGAVAAGHDHMISNRRLDFRAIKHPIQRLSANEIQLDAQAAQALNVAIGDSLRIASFV